MVLLVALIVLIMEMISDTEPFAMPVFQPLPWKLRKYIRKHATKAQEIRERLDRRKVGSIRISCAMCYFIHRWVVMNCSSTVLWCFTLPRAPRKVSSSAVDTMCRLSQRQLCFLQQALLDFSDWSAIRYWSDVMFALLGSISLLFSRLKFWSILECPRFRRRALKFLHGFERPFCSVQLLRTGYTAEIKHRYQKLWFGKCISFCCKYGYVRYLCWISGW